MLQTSTVGVIYVTFLFEDNNALRLLNFLLPNMFLPN